MLDRRIELLRVLEKAGTITEAAELLQRSVSGYSRQLRSLADELGFELLEHQGRGVRLTTAAKRLVEFANDTVAAWEKTKASLTEDAAQVTGLLRIGAHPTALSQLVIPHLREMEAQYPLLQFRLSEVEVPECFDQLVVDELDVCIVVAHAGVPPVGDRRFYQQRLVEEPIDALVSSTSSLAERKTIELSELSGYPWVLPGVGQPGRDEILGACHAAGFVPSATHHGHTTQSVADLIEATGAVSLTSRFARYGAQAVRIPVAGQPAPSRQLLICTRKGSETIAPVQTLRQLTTDRLLVKHDEGGDREERTL
ncbi:LysR substrate-binding domain-containing protein [Corynebacterium glyciniphilum]|uniref:LysR substrate-binding domain-containing protein n=1 Tax=Corynebacterium glyciniphilum TaxID=1404244 RepID=UPI0011AB751E|nr:LysR substrate-binding domain-containing protein [Corynebacterium glyciniphilum]